MNEKKVALVTGGSRGIGKTIVEKLVAEGYLVGYTFLNMSERATALEREYGKEQVIAIQADSRDKAQIKGAVDTVIETFGQLDALVNNSGITRDNLLMLQSEEEWSEVIDTNLNGVFNACKSVVQYFLRQRKGSIVNISSVAGLIGVSGQTNYCASKFGQIGFSKALALETARRGVRVNSVCPGFINTDMTDELSEEQKTGALAQIPMGRFGEPQEIADLVAFLISDRATYITGQSFVIDGGLTA